jgi:hypothetical protein
VQVYVFVDQNDILRENLRGEMRRCRRDEFLMEVMSEDLLLQIRIHPGER